jgi:glycosyltransferase involved in cell wall biosynthesis
MRLLYGFDNVMPSAQTDTEQVAHTAASLSKAGMETTLMLPTPAGQKPPSYETIRDYYRIDGAFVVRPLPIAISAPAPARQIAFARRLVRHARPPDYDVLYTRNLAVVRAGLKAGFHVVYDHYRPWTDQFWFMKYFLRPLFRHRNLRGIVLHSHYAVDSYIRAGADPERILVAHNGFDPGKMLPALTRGEARNRLGWPEEERIAVYSGRVLPKKGVQIILDLAEHLPDWIFAVIGVEERNTFVEEAEAVPNIRLVDWKKPEEVTPYLYAADTLLIPPSAEPLRKYGTTVLPMKVYSYLAAGKPIIAPDNPDLQELLHHGHNAWLVSPDDVDGAVRAFKQIAGDEDLAGSLGESARSTAEELTWDKRARRIRDWLHRVLPDTTGGP